jgi:hypothetical protein
LRDRLQKCDIPRIKRTNHLLIRSNVHIDIYASGAAEDTGDFFPRTGEPSPSAFRRLRKQFNSTLYIHEVRPVAVSWKIRHGLGGEVQHHESYVVVLNML